MVIELRNIHYFVAAAEHGSFRRAAAFLSIQESAVSRRIRDLEDRLGASLFHRHSGGVSLTVAGERFLSRVRIALQQIENGVNDVAAIGRSEDGIVKIGIFSSLASGFLFDLMKAFDEKHPRVTVELIEGNPSVHVAAVRQLQLDVAFITGTGEWPGCETEQLWTEGVFAVLPTEHGLTKKQSLRWRDLDEETFIVSDAAPGPEIRDYLVQRLADLGRHPNIHPQYVGRDVLLSMVAVGRGLTVVSEAATGARFPGVVYRQIADEVLPFSAIWSRRNDNPAFRRFLSLARILSRSESANIKRTGSPASPSQSRDPSR
ncbi:MAG: LysR family transcriptional regulator [Rhizobiales bacterium]|nr:LysR family transcriptional regulator [Hyphomicrobiales bacterium]MBN9009608.1 LysR family transcriptional regulator [Hyphomicrobiales bacterium]